MKKIVAIGGSNEDLADIKPVFSYIFQNLPNKAKLVYIPTANNDHEWYSEYMKKFFEDNYDAEVDILYLINKEINYEELQSRILSSDCIYVEGGNLGLLLSVITKERIREILYDAYNKGVIISGISAGAMCWFEYGFSDNSDRINSKENYSVVPGLGFKKGIVSPHYNNLTRKELFDIEFNNNEILKEGWGIENGSALILQDDNVVVMNKVEHLKK